MALTQSVIKLRDKEEMLMANNHQVSTSDNMVQVVCRNHRTAQRLFDVAPSMKDQYRVYSYFDEMEAKKSYTYFMPYCAKCKHPVYVYIR